MTEAQGVSVHRPKVEHFDLAARTNTDNKGFVRPVEVYREEPWGLYMSRTADHPRFEHMESWLLPDLGVRATIFHFRAGERPDQDVYLDIGVFRPVAPQRWRALDHYLDIAVQNGREAELLDTDELLAALEAGLIDAAAAEAAVLNATYAIEGLAAHGYSVDAWAGSLGMALSWR
ncbi:DUF402 domain-containing protein [Nocardia jiangsuensis]|uniref:DUF402 domain-containing protein n=1 Tax=Nocardia jiangsuensis TaxID=1691563 RepID=A0ABV8E163_9NOCA